MSGRMGEQERTQFQELLVKAVDDELSEEEKRRFEQFIDQYEACRQEWQQFMNIKEVTQEMKFRNPPDPIWETYWSDVYNRLERGVAWILLSAGTIILLVYGAFKAVESMLHDTQLETIVKIAILLVVAGFVVLLVSVIREKFFVLRRDPYKEVQR